MKKNWAIWIFAGFSLALLGCPKKPLSPSGEEIASQEEQPPTTEQPGIEPLSSSGIDIGADWGKAPEIEAVLFEYMDAQISAEGREILKKNAAVLKELLKTAPSVQIRVEGHCDERGTLEYNLALGQRRANAVRNYYASLGVPKSSLKTVSFGEEKPVCSQNLEECWSQNRRGETTLRASVPMRAPLP